MIRLRVRGCSIAKAGNQDHENEDAYRCDAVLGRLAVADGASDAFESRRWARLLADAFVAEPPVPEAGLILPWLETPLAGWNAAIDWNGLPWYGVEKARRGAFSTLLGLIVDATPEGALEAPARWRALALGDSCLFQLRNAGLVAHLPVARSADFGTTPALLSTRRDYNRRSLTALGSFEGECRPGDVFALATDALAAWLLGRDEQGQPPWGRLIALRDEELADLMDELRRHQVVRNDDMTLLLAHVEPTTPRDGDHGAASGDGCDDE